MHVATSLVLVEYRLLNQSREHGFEEKTAVVALTELIGMHGHPLKFVARLDGRERSEFKGLADAQADGKGGPRLSLNRPIAACARASSISTPQKGWISGKDACYATMIAHHIQINSGAA